MRKPRYQIINNLDNLLNIELSTWIPQFDFSPWNSSDATSMYTKFSLKLESSPGEVLRKSIEVCVEKNHIRSAYPPVPGSTILIPVHRRDSYFTKDYFLYVITSVVLANFLKISISIGEQENVYISTHVIPIGFKYKKYKILCNGTIDREIRTTLKYCDREAVWLPPIAGEILRNPLWDPMGRWHDGRRPMRNVLTLFNSSYLRRGNNQGNQSVFSPHIIIPNSNPANRNNNIQVPTPALRGNISLLWVNPIHYRQRFRNRFNALPHLPPDAE